MSLIFNVDVNRSSLGVLEEIAFRVVNAAPLMNEIGSIIYDQIIDSFENERDAIDGSPWAELAPSTIQARQRRGYTPITKLRASGRGERAITLSIASNTVRIEIGSDGQYMQYHREGTRRMPKRDFIPSPDWIEKSPKILEAVMRHINPRGFL